MSECPECNNVQRHRDGCHYGELERENATLKAQRAEDAVLVQNNLMELRRLKQDIDAWAKRVVDLRTALEHTKAALLEEGVSDSHRATTALLHLSKVT